MTAQESNEPSDGAGAVGYLVSLYPATSHTFIRREIAALRGLGLSIRTYSVRRPEGNHQSERDLEEARDTHYILSRSALGIAWLNLRALRRPGRYASTLALALRHRVPGLKALIWALFHFAEATALAHRMEADSVRHLHNHFGNAGATVGMLAAHYLAVPWSLTLHGISEFDYPAGNLLPAKLEHAEFAACVSYFGMAQAMRLSRPELWRKLHVVRCALDLDELPEAVEPAPDQPCRIVFVARLSPEKGHVGLLEVVGRLVKAGAPLHLTLVGDGPARALVEETIERLGLRAKVTLHGALDEPTTLTAIAGSDVLVLPSFMEGLPIVLMEAMALGKAVVASRVAGIPELVEDGRTGLLFHPADWSGLEEQLARLIRDADLRRRLGAAAKHTVTQGFAHPHAVLPLERLLRHS